MVWAQQPSRTQHPDGSPQHLSASGLRWATLEGFSKKRNICLAGSKIPSCSAFCPLEWFALSVWEVHKQPFVTDRLLLIKEAPLLIRGNLEQRVIKSIQATLVMRKEPCGVLKVIDSWSAQAPFWVILEATRQPISTTDRLSILLMITRKCSRVVLQASPAILKVKLLSSIHSLYSSILSSKTIYYKSLWSLLLKKRAQVPGMRQLTEGCSLNSLDFKKNSLEFNFLRNAFGFATLRYRPAH